MIDYYSLNFYQKVNFIVQNIQTFSAILGIIGSILNICVFLRPRLRRASYSIYFIAMSCADIVMMAHTFRHWSRFILGFDMDAINQFFCSFNEYQPFVAGYTSLWLLTVIAFDRMINIVYHNRLIIFKKRWFQLALTATVLIYCLLVHIKLPLNFRLILVNQTNHNYTNETITPMKSKELRCYLPPDVADYQSFVISLNVFFSNVIINNILNVITISYIKASRRRCRNKSQRQRTLIDQRFALSSIGFNFVGLFFNLSSAIGFFALSLYKLSPDQFQMAFTIGITITMLDNESSFLLNMLLNPVFCYEFLNMFGIKKRTSKQFYNQIRR